MDVNVILCVLLAGMCSVFSCWMFLFWLSQYWDTDCWWENWSCSQRSRSIQVLSRSPKCAAGHQCSSSCCSSGKMKMHTCILLFHIQAVVHNNCCEAELVWCLQVLFELGATWGPFAHDCEMEYKGMEQNVIDLICGPQAPQGPHNGPEMQGSASQTPMGSPVGLRDARTVKIKEIAEFSTFKGAGLRCRSGRVFEACISSHVLSEAWNMHIK